jgi:hypothetical protein
MDPAPGVRLYRLPSSLPRAFVAYRAETAPKAPLTSRLFDEDVIGGRTILLDGRSDWPGPGRPPVPCSFEEFTTTRLRARCTAEAPGLAVFVEQYAPGWSATVDGVPAPVLRANTTVRAVPVPAGTHVVTLTFSPPGLATGALLGLLGLCLLAWLVLCPSGGRRLGVRPTCR